MIPVRLPIAGPPSPAVGKAASPWPAGGTAGQTGAACPAPPTAACEGVGEQWQTAVEGRPQGPTSASLDRLGPRTLSTAGSQRLLPRPQHTHTPTPAPPRRLPLQLSCPPRTKLTSAPPAPAAPPSPLGPGRAAPVPPRSTSAPGAASAPAAPAAVAAAPARQASAAGTPPPAEGDRQEQQERWGSIVAGCSTRWQCHHS